MESKNSIATGSVEPSGVGPLRRFSQVVKILGSSIGLIGGILGLISFCETRQSARVEKEVKVERLLDQAWDLLGGEKGKAQLGTKYITSIQIDPKDRTNLVQRSSWDQSNLELASRKISEAVTIDPNNAKAIKMNGDVLSASGKTTEAIEEYRKAIRLDPKYAAPHNALGLILGVQGRLEEAAAEFNNAIKTKPEQPVSYHNLGLIRWTQGNFKEADSLFCAALKLAPNNVHFLTSLGGVLCAQGERDEAIEVLRRAVFLDSKNTIAHYNLGVVLFDKRELDEAIASFQMATRLDPSYSPAYNNLGTCLHSKVMYKEAINAYQTAIHLNPENLVYLENLRNTYVLQGDFDKASKLLTKIKALREASGRQE